MDVAQNQDFRSLLGDINTLDREHTSQRLSRKVAKKPQPLIFFVDRYAPALDVAVQGIYNPAALVWGLLRASVFVSHSPKNCDREVFDDGDLQALKSFALYLDSFMAAIQRLGGSLSLFAQYEALIGHRPVFQQAISDTYETVINFLQKSKTLFRRPGSLPVLCQRRLATDRVQV
jgi:hypothetical protein